LAAPRCFGVSEIPGGAYWLWLEAVEDAIGDRWPLEHYGVVARHLGQFNGAYLVGVPMPSGPWVSKGWLRRYVEQAAPSFAHLRTALDHPLIRRLLPGDMGPALLDSWDNREFYLSALDRLPRTFCHLDAFRRNLFAAHTPDGSDRTVAIDWSYAGEGAISEELVALIGASIAFFEVDATQERELHEIVVAGYLEGLRDAGWRGDPRMVELGLGAGRGVRYTLGGLGEVLALVFDESAHAHVEKAFGCSIEELMGLWSAIVGRRADLSDKVRELLDAIA
jgi:hypothetical protein